MKRPVLSRKPRHRRLGCGPLSRWPEPPPSSAAGSSQSRPKTSANAGPSAGGWAQRWSRTGTA